MNKSTIIQIDELLKTEADELFAELGLSTNEAIVLFLRQAIRFGGIPFEIRQYHPNAETIAAIEDAEAGQNLSKPYNNLSDMVKDLNA